MKVNLSAPASREASPEPITVRPPFDPQDFARQSERQTVPPPPGLPSYAPETSSGMRDVFAVVDETTVPVLTVARDDLEWFDLPPLARRVLRHVDGCARVGEICSKTGDRVDDGITAIQQLAHEGLVSCR